MVHPVHSTLQNKINLDSSQNVPTWRKQYSCNHCIQYLKRKLVLMHHTMFQHAENIILKITTFVTSKLNSFWFIREGPIPNNVPTCNHCIYHLQTKFVLIHKRRSQHVENSILAIIAYNTSKENSFWFITQCSIR